MKSLQERFYDVCTKEIKCKFPCDSCYGCENNVKAVMEYFKDKQREIGIGSWTALSKVDTINELLKNVQINANQAIREANSLVDSQSVTQKVVPEKELTTKPKLNFEEDKK